MGGLGRVWRVCNFMTQIQPQFAIKKKFCNPTQPNPPSLKNRSNPSGLAGRWVFCTPLFKIAESVFSFYLKLHNFKQVGVFY